MLISTAGQDPASAEFTNLWTAEVPFIFWNEAEIDLNSYAGKTVYIAFRYEGKDAHSWYIDDVMVENGTTHPSTYSVFRDGSEVASGLTGTTYTDNNVEAGTYNYCVQAVYPAPLDCVSNEACTSATVEGTGLASLHEQGLTLRGGSGEIHIGFSGPAESVLELSEDTAVQVFNVSGSLVRTVELSRQQTALSIKIPSGIYLVRIGNAVGKVLVTP